MAKTLEQKTHTTISSYRILRVLGAVAAGVLFARLCAQPTADLFNGENVVQSMNNEFREIVGGEFTDFSVKASEP